MRAFLFLGRLLEPVQGSDIASRTLVVVAHRNSNVPLKMKKKAGKR